MFVFKTIADPFAGRISCFRVLAGPVTGDTTLVDPRTHAKERLGQILLLQGKDNVPADALGVGDLGAVAKLKDVVTGDVLVDHEVPVEPPHIDFPEPVMSFAITPKAKGDEEKMATGLRRLSEEDPTLRMRRDPQTGEQLLYGLSQMQVEVAVDRLHSRFHVDVELHPPRVPYKETIRKESRARHRYKKQTGGRGQFGDCEILLEPLPAVDGELGYEFVDKIVGGVISQSYRPAVDKGVREAMEHGELAGAPIQGVRVLLIDGMEHSVDSSEMAFKIAGSMAFKEAYQKADPGPARADHAARGDRPRRRGGRRQRRPQLASRPPAGDGAGGRDDDDQGRGADGRDPHVLAGADLDDRRPRRLRHELPPLRGSADARRAEDHRADEEGAGRGEGLGTRSELLQQPRRRPEAKTKCPFGVAPALSCQPSAARSRSSSVGAQKRFTISNSRPSDKLRRTTSPPALTV